MSKNKKRLLNLSLFLILFIVEVLIALYVHDEFVRPYIGDILVVVLLYFFVRIFIPEGAELLPLYIFIFAAGVEVLQYFNIVSLLGLENNTLARTVIGATFDVKDIICYGAGCLIIYIIQSLVKDKYIKKEA